MRPRLVLACVALVASGCGGDKKPAAQPNATDDLLERLDTRPAKIEGAQDELRRLLADRARALAAGDAAALAATATSAQRARDRRAAPRAARIALARAHYTADELQTTRKRARIAATLSYRVRGTARPFRVRRRIEARRTGDGWRIAREAPRRESTPWEIAPFRASRSQHVVLLTPPGVDPALLRPGLERAYREIRRDLPSRELPRRVVVIAARDAPQTERLTGRIADDVVALADVAVEWGLPPAYRVRRVLSQRMIVVVSRWGSMPEADRQKTLVHEMTHTALEPDTSARTPAWLIEGAAMYVANQDRSAEAQSAAAAGTGARLGPLSKPNAIFRLDALDQRAAYAAGSAAAHAIAERYGSKRLFALFDRFNDPEIVGRPGARLTDRVLRRTLGMSLSELEAAVAGR